jgi:hypothetical protein
MIDQVEIVTTRARITKPSSFTSKSCSEIQISTSNRGIEVVVNSIYSPASNDESRQKLVPATTKLIHNVGVIRDAAGCGHFATRVKNTRV